MIFDLSQGKERGKDTSKKMRAKRSLYGWRIVDHINTSNHFRKKRKEKKSDLFVVPWWVKIHHIHHKPRIYTLYVPISTYHTFKCYLDSLFSLLSSSFQLKNFTQTHFHKSKNDTNSLKYPKYPKERERNLKVTKKVVNTINTSSRILYITSEMSLNFPNLLPFFLTSTSTSIYPHPHTHIIPSFTHKPFKLIIKKKERKKEQREIEYCSPRRSKKRRTFISQKLLFMWKLWLHSQIIQQKKSAKWKEKEKEMKPFEVGDNNEQMASNQLTLQSTNLFYFSFFLSISLSLTLSHLSFSHFHGTYFHHIKVWNQTNHHHHNRYSKIQIRTLYISSALFSSPLLSSLSSLFSHNIGTKRKWKKRRK